MFIPKEILNKKGPLTADEFEVIKTHSQKGYELLNKCYNVPPVSCLSILHHHEKYNGEGYPLKVSGDRIHRNSRIISVVDVYDALTSRRPYRKAMPPSEAIEYIMGGGGTHFDPDVVEIFCKKIPPYPVGTTIKLSDAKIGLVIENFEDCCTRPMVKIFKHGDKKVTPYNINLKNDREYRGITIIGLV
jgi:HD-GYP domain-containing protein (c-di-GMP phosphodiesterase class II)